MTHTVIMPDLGQTTAEGKIVRWLKKPGDNVGQGEALLEVETDKVTMEVECYKVGYLRAILVREGETASAMSPIAILTDRPDEAYANGSIGHKVAGETSPGSARRLTSAEPPGIPRPVTVLSRAANGWKRIPATPVAKARARESGLDLQRVVSSRPDGLITRRDVDRALTREIRSRPALGMAALTTKSVQSIPHFYATLEVDVLALVDWRSRWNADHPTLRLTLNDVFVRIAALALRDVPALNVRYSDDAIEQLMKVDLLLVVAGDRGLSLVPISDPASLSWEEYAGEMHRTRERPDRGLASPPLRGATPALAVSNLGMFGITQFTAIIPPGATAILAVGAVREAAVVRKGKVEVGKVCSLTLASDHRVVDGITAARFLERMQSRMREL